MSKKFYGNAKTYYEKNNLFSVVAVGASSGGLEAAVSLFSHLQTDTGMRYLMIQHSDLTNKTDAVDAIQYVTQMPVQYAVHGMLMQRDHVYIIPPDKDVQIVQDHFVITRLSHAATLRLPIDRFFAAVASAYPEQTIGVLLSGVTNDGTVGLQAVKDAGGIALVQDHSAAFMAMPRAAIAAGVADKVLSPPAMAAERNWISRQLDAIQQLSRETPDTDAAVNTLLALLRSTSGHDFTDYKTAVVARRIARRMLMLRITSLADYTTHLRNDADENKRLINDLLIGVTGFFRDPSTFAFIKQQIIPRLLQNRLPHEPLRIWVPACSTGQEAYSMAITVLDYLESQGLSIPLKLFASDINEDAVLKARKGTYSKKEMASLNTIQRDRYFVFRNNQYTASEQLRNCCVFTTHNVLKDVPFSRVDLISCCNVLIYLKRPAQEKLADTFHFALQAGGYLVLGRAETISPTPLFTQPDAQHKVYLCKKAGKPAAANAPVAPPANAVSSWSDEADDIIMSRYMPSGIIINQQLDILQFRGSTGKFLEHLPGKASTNLTYMAQPPLVTAIKNAVQQVASTHQPVSVKDLSVKNVLGIQQRIAVEVIPLTTADASHLFLVIFHERHSFAEEPMELLSVPVRAAGAANPALTLLQGFSEALSTRTEEIESANEELLATNQELQLRNEQLTEAYDYAESVFLTMREAIVVLDRDLRIKKANKSFYQLLHVAEEEAEGRLIYSIGNRLLNIPRLRELLEDIIPQQEEYSGYEIQHLFPGIGEKTLVLNARRVYQKAHRRQLILLTIEDITGHRKVQQIVAEQGAWFRNMADNAPVMMWVTGPDGKAGFFNRTWLDFTGRTMEEETGSGFIKNIHLEDINAFNTLFHQNFLERKPFQLEYRLRHKDGEYRWCLNIGKPVFAQGGQFTGYIVSCTDIHDKKLAEEEMTARIQQKSHELQQINKALQRANTDLKQYAHVASHDLQEPLRKIILFSDLLLQQAADLLPDTNKSYIDKIIRSASRMSDLLEDLLNFSRITSNSEAFVNTDLNIVMEQVQQKLAATISRQMARISFTALPVIEAMPSQMALLFEQLIGNALKFAHPHRTPEISITAKKLSNSRIGEFEQLDSSLLHYEVVISDNGIGFNQEFAQQIFVIFQRLNDRREFSGTGMGLALCRKVIAYHNGEIYATSEEGRGSSFHIILPARQ